MSEEEEDEEKDEEEELEEEEDWQGIKCGTKLHGALQTRKQRFVLNTLFFYLKTFEGGDRQMAKCPTCGKEVETPIKEWNMGRNKKIHVKQYECCGKKFREYGKKVQGLCMLFRSISFNC